MCVGLSPPCVYSDSPCLLTVLHLANATHSQAAGPAICWPIQGLQNICYSFCCSCLPWIGNLGPMTPVSMWLPVLSPSLGWVSLSTLHCPFVFWLDLLNYKPSHCYWNTHLSSQVSSSFQIFPVKANLWNICQRDVEGVIHLPTGVLDLSIWQHLTI